MTRHGSSPALAAACTFRPRHPHTLHAREAMLRLSRGGKIIDAAPGTPPGSRMPGPFCAPPAAARAARSTIPQHKSP